MSLGLTHHTPNLPAKSIPAEIARLKLSGESPMGLGIPPPKTNILLESNHLKSRILVRRLAVPRIWVILLSEARFSL